MNHLPRPFAFPLHPPALTGAERRLGDYELLDELATGRSFRVDLALAPNGTPVVLKRLRGKSLQTRARLEREARVGSSSYAPNLLRVHEFMDQPESVLVLEYVRGATLQQLLANAGPNDLRHALWAFIGALHGLASLHSYPGRGALVHQAPVARHVLVGIDGVSRLIDLSHVRGACLGDCAGSDQGLVLSELAPEQVQREPLDPRSDVFIAGHTLRELLARCRGTHHTLLEDVWRRATRPRPTDRFLSAHELACALVRAAQREGLTSTPEQLGNWVHGRLAHEPTLSGSRADTPRASKQARAPASVRHDRAETPPLPRREEARSFVPPRVSMPHLAPSAERMSSVWYSVVAQPSDDDVVRAIAASKPLRPRKRKLDLRSIGRGMTLGGLTLAGLIAMGASPRQVYAPVQASAPVEEASMFMAPSAPPAPPPVPSVQRLEPRVQAPSQEGPWQRREREARRSQAKRHPGARAARELIRMTGSVPENPY